MALSTALYATLSCPFGSDVPTGMESSDEIGLDEPPQPKTIRQSVRARSNNSDDFQDFIQLT